MDMIVTYFDRFLYLGPLVGETATHRNAALPSVDAVAPPPCEKVAPVHRQN
jgi:hypothetical protein